MIIIGVYPITHADLLITGNPRMGVDWLPILYIHSNVTGSGKFLLPCWLEVLVHAVLK